MAGTTVTRRGTAMPDSEAHEFFKAEGQYANVVADLARLSGNRCLTLTGAGVSSDANAQDIETDNAIHIRVNGFDVAFAAVAAFDISVSGSVATVPGAATISTSKCGAGWVFAHPDGTLDVQTDVTTATHASAIIALSQYANPSTATRLLPPTGLHVPIGVVQVTEGGSGAWTWGTDSIAGETETFYDLVCIPGVLSAPATFAKDDGAATFNYGAAKIVLGSGVYVALTGKTSGVTISGTAVANNGVGAWLFYALADDTEYAFQLGYGYASLAAAQTAVRNHTRNPLMPVLGVIYVVNNSGSDFTPGTTTFDAAGISATFSINVASPMEAALITLGTG